MINSGGEEKKEVGVSNDSAICRIREIAGKRVVEDGELKEEITMKANKNTIKKIHLKRSKNNRHS